MPARTGRRWQSVKARVIARDHGICWLCGHPGADSADHVRPVRDGGAIYDLTNLAAVHHNNGPRCNLIRGARTPEAARADIARLIETPTDWDW